MAIPKSVGVRTQTPIAVTFMKLTDIVIENAIIPDLASPERDEAIGEIVDALVAAGALSEKLKDEFVKAVIKREKRGSTGFGHGVAVPHVKHPSIAKMAVAIGISRAGIDFNALDKQPVHSIFLLLSPEDRPEDHLDAMEAIFSNLSQETFRRFLRQATSVADVMTLLEEADSRTTMR
jgi:PTS system nitrogen regulatory IIA component